MACVNIVLFLFFYFFALNSRAENGIIDCSSGTSNHTMCLHFQNYSLELCENYKENTLTPHDRNFLVTFHNNLRTEIVKGAIKYIPKGFYIKKLSWNPDLASLAQKWAEQCQSGKVSDFRIFKNQLLGRNVAIVNVADPSTVNLERLMSVWSAGLNHLTPEIINSYRKPTTRANDYEPAAQMIWWNTSQIGCSRSIYKPIVCTKNEGKKICATNRPIAQLVCTYFPVGNRAGEPIFNTNDNKKYLCHYENNELLCTNLRLNERPTRRKETYRDSMIHRMRDDWDDLRPAVMNCAKSWNLDFLFYTYILFFFVYFIH